MIRIEDMMTRHPHTLEASNSLREAQEMMQTYEIRHIPIIDTNHILVGILSQRDLLRAQDSSLLHQPTDSSLLHAPISKLMRPNVISVSPQAGLKESALHMQKHHVGCLPVCEKGVLVGIITDSDFVSIAINLLELEEQSEVERFEE
jgi:CBS domain-containing membrane protein